MFSYVRLLTYEILFVFNWILWIAFAMHSIGEQNTTLGFEYKPK